MSDTYADFALQVQPGWTRDPSGADALHSGKGDVKDALVERAKAAVISRLVLRAPADALQALGAERGIPQGVSETDAAYALRLRHAWDVWPYAGTALGVLTALLYAGYTNVVLLQVRTHAYSLDGSGNLVITSYPGASPYWSITNNPASWSRFMVLFPQALPLAWLGTGTTTVLHGGSGAGTVSVTGNASSDVRVIVRITSTAAAGTATYVVSTDNGTTWGASATVASFALAGLTVTLAGALVSGDTYSFAPNFNVPSSGSPEATRIKAIVNTWAPVAMSLSRYVIHTSGFIWGWPVTQTWGQTGRRWGGTTTTWTP